MKASRRVWIERVLAVPFAGVSSLPLRAWALPTPPACEADEPVTVPQMEGPFFKPRSPLRHSLRDAAIPGKPLVVTGRVLARDCRPVPGALLDFWHCDAGGEYDNVGFALRGHQFTDADGRYRLETIVPGQYPGRVRHVHVKVQAANGPVLTTQLYFPGEPGNAKDFLFRPELLMSRAPTARGDEARFDFVVRTA
ncbi:MAG: intradiol ring-cleavage dioxygenase [Burkholderiales bacterium]